jgi:hypothetical protein
MAIKTITADKDSRPARDTIRQQLNTLTRALYYFLLNGIMSTTTATLPACATATVTSKVKTTNATVTKNSGVAHALGASDNFWTLTGGDIAISMFRRYLLLVDGAGVATVQASTDAATKAACVFSGLPVDGLAIAGILTVATDGTHTFTPATTLLGAAGITATYIDSYDDSVFPFAVVNV